MSKDFRFVHIDAGIGENGLQRVLTETNEDEILHCFLYPIIDKMVRDEFLDLQGIALTIHITWV